MWTAFVAGVATSGSLILALGAQNVFVLRQGLQREFVATVVCTCALVDACLLAVGVFGVSGLARLHPSVLWWITLAGSAFLTIYGAMAARRAVWPSQAAQLPNRQRARGWTVVCSQTLAVSLLNPHVYLDTVFLVGAVGAQYPSTQKALFWAGAACMSVAWFVSLGFGAHRLAPVFAKPSAWRWLDALVALTMWSLAIGLLAR